MDTNVNGIWATVNSTGEPDGHNFLQPALTGGFYMALCINKH
jgi:hypothetical protein